MAEPMDEHWQTVSAEIFSGMREWRAQHPRATMREHEQVLDARLARLRAQMLADLATSSPAADWADQPPEEQPRCPTCQEVLTPRGAHSRHLRSLQNELVLLLRQYGTCPACGRGFFPPR